MSTYYAIPPAQLNWHGNEPHARQFGDRYFSQGEGLAESRHVFLQHNRLPRRWQGRDGFVIGETGFGSGLNFLATWQLWRETAAPAQRLHFISVEGHPLTREDLARTLALWPELAELGGQLLAQYPPLIRGEHRLQFDNGQVILTLLFGEVMAVLPSLQAKIDAWYLDGFDPAKNPAMWHDRLYRQLARLSAPKASFATFTAAGHVRRGLQQAGFQVERAPGFGKKHEMLQGTLAQPVQTDDPTPWYRLPEPRPAATAIVIGTGIAGATSAYQLTRRGWQVTVLDRHPSPAAGASGNPAGAFYPALSQDYSLFGRFYLSAFLYARRLFDQWHSAQQDFGWLGDGLLQLGYTERLAQRQQQIARALGESDIARLVNPQQASEISGFAQQYGGLYFPQAGWLSPPRLCDFLLQQAAAQCHYGIEVQQLQQQPSGWCIETNRQTFQADCVVIAAGDGSSLFQQTAELPLRMARGQITIVPATPQSQQLQHPLCHEGYVLPTVDQHHVIGASYAPDDRGEEIRLGDQQHNLTLLTENVLGFAQALDNKQALQNRVGIRATTPDRLPLVGPVPDLLAFEQDYGGLNKGRAPHRYPPARYLEGLYLLGGLGSRGMTSALLCSELLACQISGEPLPLAKELVDALHPARFVIRALRRLPQTDS